MSAAALLDHLKGVRRCGPNRWVASCPAHEDKTPSLSIRELDDGRLLVHCFGKDCSFEDIVAGAGVDVAEMFPPAPPRAEGYRRDRRPFLPADVFQIAKHEIAVASLIACDMHARKAVSDADYERLLIAAGRLERIADTAYGR